MRCLFALFQIEISFNGANHVEGEKSSLSKFDRINESDQRKRKKDRDKKFDEKT